MAVLRRVLFFLDKPQAWNRVAWPEIGSSMAQPSTTLEVASGAQPMTLDCSHKLTNITTMLFYHEKFVC